MKRSSGPKTVNWGIPAFRSKDGFKTCPMAGQCVKGCYAKQGAYTWSNVKPAFERRLKLSRSLDFVSIIGMEISRRSIKRVRIHDSGDFYNRDYLLKWVSIANDNMDVEFYAYTKMVDLVKSLVFMPENLTIIYSYGGKQDALIDVDLDRHSRVFDSLKSLQEAGYVDTSHDDYLATGINPKIGLIYHGAKGKAWAS